jgi:hypothetical protein
MPTFLLATMLSVALLLSCSPAPTSTGERMPPPPPDLVQATTYTEAVLADSPVAYWPLNDTSGTVATDLTGQYPGTYQGAPLLGQAGLLAGSESIAPAFDGVDDRVTADALATRSDWPGFTLEIWVEVTQTEVEEHPMSFNLIGDSGPGLLRDEPTDRFKYRDAHGGATAFSTTVPTPDSSYYLAVTVDDSNRGTLYVDGLAEATFVTGVRPPAAGMFTIGAEYDLDPTSFWHGRLEDAAVYDHALPAERVEAHYAAGLLAPADSGVAPPDSGVGNKHHGRGHHKVN